MLFYALRGDDVNAYFEQYSFLINGKVNRDVFFNSLTILIKRHEALRTRFVADRGTRPLQLILENQEPELTVQHLEDLNIARQHIAVIEHCEADRQRSFQLQTDPLFRASLLYLTDQTLIVLSYHHIILDGWSFAIVLKELFTIINAQSNKLQIDLKPPVPFQRILNWLQQQPQKAATEFWHLHLAIDNDFEITGLPAGYGLKNADERQMSLNTVLDAGLTRQIQQTAAHLQVSVNTMAYAIWGILLARYNQVNKVITGITVSGRQVPVEDATDIVGMCINTIPFAFNVDDGIAVADYIQTISANFIQSIPYQYCSLADIQQRAGINTLFNHLVVIEDYPVEEITTSAEFPQFDISAMEVFEETHYPLSVHISIGTEMLWRLAFKPDAYPETMIRQALDHVALIASQLCSAVKQNSLLSSVTILDERVKNNILNNFNNSKHEYPEHDTLLSLYYQQLSKTGAATFMSDEQHRFNLNELEILSGKIEATLIREGVKKGDTVAVFAQRSVWLIACIMAIFKRGGVYVPIDINHPADRVDYILNDCQIKVVLCYNNAPIPQLSNTCKVLNVDDISDTNVATSSNIDAPAPNDAAYIIYTSGSTGNPKGVIVQHRAVVNALYDMQQKYSLGPDDCMLQKTTATFDVSVTELFYWIFSGCQTYFLPQGHETDPLLIGEAIHRERVTATCFVPSLLLIFLDATSEKQLLNLCSLRYVFSAGEALPLNTVKTFNRLLYSTNKTQLINLYGPTETTIYCTQFVCSPFNNEQSYVPIGKPMFNYQLYVLDKQLNVLPPWIPGILYISGKSVAKGYNNNLLLTAERFINDCFTADQIMYNSGDLAMWNNDGEIIFLGRADDQLKFNGQRIEPGEIEAAILCFEGLTDAVVILSGNNNLVGFYIGNKVDETDLKTHLIQLLPAYMVPSQLVWIETIPRSGSGKIDKKSLRANHATDSTPATYGHLFNDTVQLQLLKLWKDVLEKPIRPDFDFFANGGHSLSAIRLIAAIRKHFNISISLPDLFRAPTLQMLAAHIKSIGTGVTHQFGVAPVQQYYPLTPAQESLYVLQQLPGIGCTYQMPAIVTLSERPHELRLSTAIQQLIYRHAALRTQFVNTDGDQIYQEVLSAQDVCNTFTQQGAVHYLEAAQGKTASKWLHGRSIIDIAVAPLFKAYIIAQDDNTVCFVLDVHHLISDEHSNNLLINELLQLYNGIELSLPKFQYPDVAHWYLHTYLQDTLYIRDKKWWQQHLAELPSPLELPLPVSRPAHASFAGAVYEEVLPSSLTNWVYQSAMASSVTPFSVLFTAFQVLLSRYALQDDFLVGIPVTNRSTEEMNNIVGLMVNTLPYRCRVQHDGSFTTHLKQTGIQMIELMEHVWYPLAYILREQHITRTGDRHPLFSVLFNYINTMGGTPLQPDAMSSDEIISESKFDLSIEIKEQAGKFSIGFNYRTDLFNHDYIKRLYHNFITLVKNIQQNETLSLGDLDIIDDDEKNTLLSFGQGHTHRNEFNTLQQILQAAHYYYTDLPAIVGPGLQLSYLQLQRLANGIAQKIIQAVAVEKDTVIAICMTRSCLTLAAVHAVILAGAAYLPLDPDLPEERLKFMLEDSGAVLILHEDKPLTFTTVAHCKIDNSLNALYIEHRMAEPGDLAYIIYTSGSTGKPKGVMIEQSSVVNRLCWLQRDLPTNITDTWLWKTAFTFDVSVGELFGWALGGSKLYVLPAGDEKNPEAIIKTIAEFNITRIHFVASMLQIFVEYVQTFGKQKQLTSLTKVLTSGEAVTAGLIKAFDIAFETQKELIIMYGPTETTVEVSSISGNRVQHNTVSIGKPLDNVNIYIVHPATNKLQPAGINGEIVIGGINVARGYKNRFVLQHKLFRPDPFKSGQRVYYSNDIGSWMPDGTIQFKGRADTQIKLNGYRIELQEIEKVLEQNQQVKKALAHIVTSPSGNKELVAFVQTTAVNPEQELLVHLKQFLPAYMIPSSIIPMVGFVLNNNGKVNLPELEKIYLQTCQHPQNELTNVSDAEQQLLDIFHQILGRTNVMVTDDFFASGGHSILAIKLINRIQQRFNIKINLPDIFSHTTVRSLAGLLQTSVTARTAAIPLLPVQPFYNLSPAQRRLWFLQQLQPNDIAYNMTYAFKIPGNYDPDILKHSFTDIVQRHDQLRARFILHDDGPVSEIYTAIDPDLYLSFYKDALLSHEQIVEMAGIFCNRPFALDQAPLIRVLIVPSAKQEFYVILNMHHIITDGWSMTNLLNELVSIYQAKINGQTLQLPPVTVRYTDIAQWFQSHIAENQDAYAAYWLQRIDQNVQAARLPALSRHKPDNNQGNTIHVTLQPETVSQIHDTALQWNCTANQVMLYSYTVLLASLSNNKNFVFGLSVSGRIHPDMENVAGFFVNMMPVIVQANEQLTVKDFFDNFTNSFLQDMQYQAFPFDELAALIQHEKGIKLSALIKTRFVYNDFSNGVAAPNDGFTVEELNIGMQGSKFDLSFTVQPHNNTLTLNAEYKTAVYDESLIISYIQQWEALIINLSRSPQQLLKNFLSHPQSGTKSNLRQQSYQLLKNLQEHN